MKFTYDKEVDAAYIYLEYPIHSGQVEKTVELNENINLDYDSEGKLLGVEILNAKKNLKEKTLEEAEKNILRIN